MRYVLLALSLVAAPPAAAQCFPERTIDIQIGKLDGFGTLGGLPPLPLSKGEYVLTFDDGPNPKVTPQILSALATACVHATFFEIGRNAEKYPDVTRSVIAAGHNVGSHGYTHSALTKMTPEAAKDEVMNGMLAVRHASQDNARPWGKLIRLPENKGNADVMALTRSLGMTVASYDVTPADWRGDPPAVTLGRLRGELDKKDRGVIVLHDAQSNTALLFPMVLDELRKRGARIVHLSLTSS